MHSLNPTRTFTMAKKVKKTKMNKKQSRALRTKKECLIMLVFTVHSVSHLALSTSHLHDHHHNNNNNNNKELAL